MSDQVIPELAIVDAPSSAITEEFEKMTAGEDGWCDWVHPLPGYRMKCCDCGLVHDMEFEIATPNGDEPELNPGEGEGVIIFRAKRGDGR